MRQERYNKKTHTHTHKYVAVMLKEQHPQQSYLHNKKSLSAATVKAEQS